jgi:hypothetical protein
MKKVKFKCKSFGEHKNVKIKIVILGFEEFDEIK